MKEKVMHLAYALFAMLTLILYVMLFVWVDNPMEGHVAPWSIAIVLGVLGIFFVGMALDHAWKDKRMGQFYALLTLWWLNVMMIVWSILDLADIGNHLLSFVTFVAVPALVLTLVPMTMKTE